MSCPNCGQQLSPRHLDNQTVFHCSNCGGTFFEENGINRLSLKSAVQLAVDKKTDEISSEIKHCPKDGNRLVAVLNDEAIPRGVTLLRCQRCRGIFAFPEDLVNFKQAQNTKVDYYKMWETPLSSLRAVIVLSFILFISASLYFTYSTIQRNASLQLQAANQIKNLEITSSGRFLIVAFQTNSADRSQIIFNDQTLNKKFVKTIAPKNSKNHVFTSTQLNLSDNLSYQIVLYLPNGTVVKTPERKLTTK